VFSYISRDNWQQQLRVFCFPEALHGKEITTRTMNAVFRKSLKGTMGLIYKQFVSMKWDLDLLLQKLRFIKNNSMRECVLKYGNPDPCIQTPWSDGETGHQVRSGEQRRGPSHTPDQMWSLN